MKGHMVSNEISITFCAFETIYTAPSSWHAQHLEREQTHENAVDKTREHANK